MWPSGPSSPGGGEFQLASPRRKAAGFVRWCPQTHCWWPCLQACTGVWKSFANSLTGLRPLKARGGPRNHVWSGTTGMTVRSACCSRSSSLPTLQGIESIEQIVSLCQSDLEAVRVAAREATLSFGKVQSKGLCGTVGSQGSSGDG